MESSVKTQLIKRLGGTLLLSAAVLVTLAAEPAHAQSCGSGNGCADYYSGCTIGLGVPGMDEAIAGDVTPPASAPAPNYDSFAFSGGSQGSVGNPGAVYGGYIDPAMPMNQVRMRYDASFDFLQPDRAEFFYAACGCAGGPGPGNPNTMPVTVNSGVDSQDFSIYLESKHGNDFSWFVEMPFRQLDAGPNNIGGTPTLTSGRDSGLGDMNAGFKYVLASDCCNTQMLTFQFRVYIPSGDADRGLGTNHVSLEPAILYQNQLTDRITLFGEIRDWISVDGFQLNGADFGGNVLRYGAGIGYTIHENCQWKVTPMLEVVGWSILDGLMTDTPVAVVDANGTIVNMKFGARITNQCSIFGRPSSMYVGYGRAVTGDRWYQDIVRAEYSIMF